MIIYSDTHLSPVAIPISFKPQDISYDSTMYLALRCTPNAVLAIGCMQSSYAYLHTCPLVEHYGCGEPMIIHVVLIWLLCLLCQCSPNSMCWWNSWFSYCPLEQCTAKAKYKVAGFLIVPLGLRLTIRWKVYFLYKQGGLQHLAVGGSNF
jgi:hypothetical protein